MAYICVKGLVHAVAFVVIVVVPIVGSFVCVLIPVGRVFALLFVVTVFAYVAVVVTTVSSAFMLLVAVSV